MARSKALAAIARPVADALHAATAAAAAVPGATPTNPPSPPSVPSGVLESALRPPTTINEIRVHVPTDRAAPTITIPTIDGDLPVTDLHPLVSTPRRTYTPAQLQAASLFFGRPANLVRLKRIYWLISAPSLLDTRFELAEYDRAVLDLVTSVRVPFTAVLTKIDVIPSTSAFLRCTDALHRDLLDRAQGLGDTVLCTSAKSKITPQWDVHALGDPDLVRSIGPGLKPPVLHGLGLVSAMADQARVEDDGAVLLTRPGIAAVQAHILQATGQKLARWEGKVTRLATPKVPPAVDLMAMKREIGKAQRKAKKAKRRR
ncbi:hypothetical protein, variant [Allomyces macrogynus ATCC 38327]|uniref:Uncharacterized protein n=1 Tax=Allomyces macrogynus (strain ATCC 38327) TaxID=578462 RepID=A0A0L0SYH6_ALLM3|nr:hypothetical protein, variant [Allomyces macrogynus ATCC 38327]|eukprot:KNE67546.1 hypothetical protein, variant [Allomyces macrogynus ATCC 38327]